jgi:hypothetical protein
MFINSLSLIILIHVAKKLKLKLKISSIKFDCLLWNGKSGNRQKRKGSSSLHQKTADKILKDSKKHNSSYRTTFHFCCSRVIGLDMTENRIFTLCRMITWVVFLRMFWNYISSLLVKRGESCLQTDGRTWWNQYTPLQLCCGGYKKIQEDWRAYKGSTWRIHHNKRIF